MPFLSTQAHRTDKALFLICRHTFLKRDDEFSFPKERPRFLRESQAFFGEDKLLTQLFKRLRIQRSERQRYNQRYAQKNDSVLVHLHHPSTSPVDGYRWKSLFPVQTPRLMIEHRPGSKKNIQSINEWILFTFLSIQQSILRRNRGHPCRNQASVAGKAKRIIQRTWKDQGTKAFACCRSA